MKSNKMGRTVFLSLSSCAAEMAAHFGGIETAAQCKNVGGRTGIERAIVTSESGSIFVRFLGSMCFTRASSLQLRWCPLPLFRFRCYLLSTFKFNGTFLYAWNCQ